MHMARVLLLEVAVAAITGMSPEAIMIYAQPEHVPKALPQPYLVKKLVKKDSW